jgi:ferric-dicitrate binding protein FerR (iron transport regulator)
MNEDMKKDLIDKAIDCYFEDNSNSKVELTNQLAENEVSEKYKNAIKALNISKSNQASKKMLVKDFDHVFERIETKNKQINFQYFKYVAAILIGFIVSYFVFQDYSDFIEYKTYANQKTEIFLKDGTKVKLEENSELQVPKDFSSANRNVKFEGLAYFEVTKSTTSKFKIKMGTSDITVLGTKFVVDNQKDKNYFKLFLEEGKVQIDFNGENGGKQILLTNNEQVYYNKRNKKSYKTSFSKTIKFQIDEQTLEFNNESLQEVINCLNILYNKKYRITNEKLKHKKINGVYKEPNVENIVSNIRALLEFEIVKNKNDKIDIK